MLITGSMALITVWRWGRGATGGITPTRSIAVGVDLTKTPSSPISWCSSTENDGVFWNRRDAAARS
jgi:hypothetical protein